MDHPEHEFLFFFDRPYSDTFIFSDNIKPVVLFPPARHPLLWYWWFEHSVPKALNKSKADLFLSPDGYLSLSVKVLSVSIIHDINFHHRPYDLPFWSRKYYRYYFPKYAKKADKIVTVSNYSKKDISSSYYVPEDKIEVAYNGASLIFKPIPENEKEDVKKRYSRGSDYFVFVGTLHPRKNIPGLFRAFDRFKEVSDKDLKLVIVGEKMFMTREIEQTLIRMKFKSDVIFTGRLSPEELRYVYGASTALTFVPFIEGFGLPVVEAMNCDTAILASDATSLPEVGGDAVCYVDPFNVESIAEGMLKITSDERYRSGLIERGRKQCKKFSWDKTAEKLWKVIIEILQ